MTLKKGDKAPAFKLYSTDKQLVSSDDYKGKNLIVHIYPQAFTGTCTNQMCTVRESISKYHNDKADVVAVSVDSVFTLIKFKEEQKLNFPLLSDFNHEMIGNYSGYYDKFAFDMKGVGKRAVFVIDTNGIVQHAEIVEVPSDMPNFEALDKALESLGVPAVS